MNYGKCSHSPNNGFLGPINNSSVIAQLTSLNKFCVQALTCLPQTERPYTYSKQAQSWVQPHHIPHSVPDVGPNIWLLKSYIAPLGMLLLLESDLPLIPSTQEKILLLLLGNSLPGTIF